MNVQTILAIGVAIAVAIYAITYALHLLNQPSDLAVGAGYLILLLLFASAVEAIRRIRNRWNHR